MTRARAKAIHDKVNSLLSSYDFNTALDGVLLLTDMLLVIRYNPQEHPHGWTTREAKLETRETRPEEEGPESPTGHTGVPDPLGRNSKMTTTHATGITSENARRLCGESDIDPPDRSLRPNTNGVSGPYQTRVSGPSLPESLD